MKWYLLAYNNYLNFRGRARRKEFWYFTLFHFFFILLTNEFDKLLVKYVYGTQIWIINLIYILISFFPGLTVSIRRLHDVGKSWGFYFTYFFTFIIWYVASLGVELVDYPFSIIYILTLFLLIFWPIYFLARPGDVGENAYGPDPKASLGS